MWWLMTRWTRSQYTAISQNSLLTEDDPEIGDALKEGREREVRRKWQIKPAIKCNFSGVLILVAGAALLIALTIQCTIWYLLSRGMPGLRPTEFCKNGRNLRLYGTMIDKFAAPLYRLFNNIHYEIATIRTGHLATADAPDHIYRQPQSVEVHDAWVNLTDTAIFPITRNEVIRLGKDPDYAVKAPEEWGWPKDSYLASLEVFHHLHCLDVLRRNLLHHYHVYWGVRFGFSPNLVWTWHLTHCLDILRQHLMCNADTAMFIYSYVEGQTEPQGDFTVQKKCINFDQIHEWNYKKRQDNLLHSHEPPWRSRVAPIKELPPAPGVPRITNETVYVDYGDGLSVPTGVISGLEGKEYCLGEIGEYT